MTSIDLPKKYGKIQLSILQSNHSCRNPRSTYFFQKKYLIKYFRGRCCKKQHSNMATAFCRRNRSKIYDRTSCPTISHIQNGTGELVLGHALNAFWAWFTSVWCRPKAISRNENGVLVEETPFTKQDQWGLAVYRWVLKWWVAFPPLGRPPAVALRVAGFIGGWKLRRSSLSGNENGSAIHHWMHRMDDEDGHWGNGMIRRGKIATHDHKESNICNVALWRPKSRDIKKQR